MAVNNGPGPVPGPNVGPGPGSGPGPVPAGGGPAPVVTSPAQRLDAIDEQVWLQLGSLAESMGEFDRAMASYESALRHNHYSVSALNLIAELYRSRENFPKAAEYFQRILAIDNASGEVWGSLGHCYLMMDELQKAYNAYQNALHHLPNPKDSKLWYGIGILYDRYGSVEHAEEAFSAVMRMDPKYEKANEIYFRLGIIYKGQQKYVQSLECFRYILHAPPRPLTEADIWFQIGHVHEQQKEYTSAKEAYERVLTDNPNHAKVLQQLGWLYHQQNASFMNQDLAIKFLTRSIESDNTDAQSWYLMGRCYMAQQKFNKAYEAYQQAVYRDSRNPTFWCSIGLLYFQINQYRDALDAYSKAIRINPNISEVWYDLGTLYESCNNQVSDAIDAYQRASDLDPENPHIKQRLAYLRQNNGAPGGIPPPEEMNPNAYPLSGGATGQNPFGQRITVAPQGPPTGMQGYTGRQQGPPAPLSAAANGDHQQPGRDLPLPGNGNGGNNGHANAGPTSGSPGSYPHEERQPHIPGINTGGPRPPTPAGAMPQMMSNERMHSQPPQPPSGHVQGRGGPRARPPSPGPEGPYGRSGSPGMHAGGPHGHDPHYQGPPHPSYSQGPPPPGLYNMMSEGQPQGYDRHEDARMKQEQHQHGAPVYQHHRHRSSDLSRMAPMEEDPNAPPGFSRQGHPSDPHAHAASPPRDDRRPPMATPNHPQGQHPSQQQHQSDPRWMPPHHGRHPSDEQARMSGPPSGPDRGGPTSQIRQPSEMDQQHRHMQQRPYPEQDRNDSHGAQNRSPPLSGVSPDRKDPERGGERMAHDHNPDQHRRGYEGDVPSEQERAWSAQESHSGSKFRTEDQDQDIAASLVSLSGKGPERPPISSHRAEDDDYDMEEAGPAPAAPQSSHTSMRESEQPPHHNQQHRPQADDRYPADHQERPHHETQGQPPRQSSQPPRDEREPSPPSETPAVLTPPNAPSPKVAEQDLPSTSMVVDEKPAPRGPSAEPEANAEDQESPSSAVNPAPERASSPTVGRRASESSDPKQPAPVQAPAPSEPATSVVSVAPVEDEDTEMEEGEVREDDEVMSSGAVAPAHSNGGNKDADN
ncbi:general transcriptional corepressor CYC8 [Entomortierella parvispora]|uniref:General transcriptional corepressor CYC8 n=1 Tax=Entomortierella parvispora TaxID=205924 RepID=A0A9P3LTR2_9FUNG|nr:general transcriptional corepressor CYC8 [Entomortierella parvispora]